MRPRTATTRVPCLALALTLLVAVGDQALADPPADRGIAYPGRAPGEATTDGVTLALSNGVLEACWTDDSFGPGPLVVHDVEHGRRWALGDELFVLVLGDGAEVPASAMDCRTQTVEDGRLSARYLDSRRGVEVRWSATLEDDAHYLRQHLTVTALEAPVVVREIRLFDVRVPGARRVGSVPGSVIDLGGLFVAAEHPMAENDAGYPMERVGTWSPASVTWPERSTMRWDVTGSIAKAGPVEVLFQYVKGGHRLEVHGATLRADGEVVATDDHFGATGSRDVENRFRFDLAAYDPNATYTVSIEGLSDGGTDSHGWVGLAHVDGPPTVTCTLKTETELPPGQSTTLGAVVGRYPEGQLRRAFLRYLERERAHPYRPFLHYNSWYDIGFFSKYDEAACLDVVKTYGEELVRKRGATIDSFLFDDGWDDTASLWDFHEGLPHGFVKVRELAASYGAAPGVWLSPWGGYGKPREQRLEAGKAAGYETTDAGFALSAPRYYARFRDICLEMIRTHGANHFKFDGVRRGGGRYLGSAFGSDFEAAIALIDTLREARPDVYVNQTTGTWPSPFWLLFADSIWRGGHDHEFAGVGSKRQQWITYRDAKTYENVVRGGPLFPLSSLMLHGVIYAKHARGLKDDPRGDLRDEIRSAFGCGTQLQELYVTPALLTEENWDDLAQSARWARERAATLRDVHWIGGSPARLEVYGWGAWSPGRATLTLRNPADRSQGMQLDVARILELPAGAATAWSFEAPYADQRVKRLGLTGGKPRELVLEPFEVVVFDGQPAD